MACETNSILCKLFLLTLNKSLEKGDERSHSAESPGKESYELKDDFSKKGNQRSLLRTSAFQCEKDHASGSTGDENAVSTF